MMNDKFETGASRASTVLVSVSDAGEGFPPHSAAVVIDSRGVGDDGRSSILHPDAAVTSFPVASGTVDSCDVANANGIDRSDEWRIACHEAGHVLIHRIFNNPVSCTIIPDAECRGKTTWPVNVDMDAAWGADVDFSDPGLTGDGRVRSVFSIVQKGVIALMGGCAAEMALLGDEAPKYIFTDIPHASHFASVVCRTEASRVSFLEHGYQESLALVEQHKEVVQALAQALVDHPKKTLNTVEIDSVIEIALAAKAVADKQKRRIDWARIEQSAAAFGADK
jgi:hypothetical protein